MVELFQCDLDQVVLSIVSDADQCCPLGFDLVTEVQRDDFDFGPLADQAVREEVKVRAPIGSDRSVRPSVSSEIPAGKL